jgi:hypothetical protein
VRMAWFMSCRFFPAFYLEIMLTFPFYSRGKKTFRKFTEKQDSGSVAEESEPEVEDELDETVSSNLRRPLTRSAVKPRLLFPTAQQIQAKEARSQYTEDEEEAVTDIETEDHLMSTPLDQVDEIVRTPKAPKFAPASPPTTIRATRSKDICMTGSPADQITEANIAGSVSPFDSWQRTKRDEPVNKKRSGSPMTSKAGRGGKKIRG